MAGDEVGRLDEHAARPAGGVEDLAVERFEDLDDELDDRGRGEELAAALALGHGELAEEVLVDQAEAVALDVVGQRVERAQQLDQHVVRERAVHLGQHALEVGVVVLDRRHGVVDDPPKSADSGWFSRWS